MIEFNQSMELDADTKSVWSVLSDPLAVAQCVDGAILGAQRDDGTYDARMTVRFGPTSVTFAASVDIELDATSMAGRVQSKGKDSKGGARFETVMAFHVEERKDRPGSIVPIAASVKLAGRLAPLIETGASFVVKRLTKDFSERLSARLGVAEPADMESSVQVRDCVLPPGDSYAVGEEPTGNQHRSPKEGRSESGVSPHRE